MKIELNEGLLTRLITESVAKVLQERKNRDLELLRQSIDHELDPIREAGFTPKVFIGTKFDDLNIFVRFPDNDKIAIGRDESYRKFVEDTLRHTGFEYDSLCQSWIYKKDNDILNNAQDKTFGRLERNLSHDMDYNPRQWKINSKRADMSMKQYNH